MLLQCFNSCCQKEYYPYFIDLLKAVKGMVGKDGPCYLEHGIVTASNEDVKLDVLRKAKDQMLLVEPGHLAFGFEDTSGEMSIIPIGEQGRKVTNIIIKRRGATRKKNKEKPEKKRRSRTHNNYKHTHQQHRQRQGQQQQQQQERD